MSHSFGKAGTEEKFGPERTIMFETCKKEVLTPSQGFRILAKKLRTNFKIIPNKEEISLDVLKQARLVIIGGPRERFSENEFKHIKNYINEGGSVLVLLGEGGENQFGTNINYLLEEYGISVNSDCVVRTVYYKYFHPKEVCITNGILNRNINRAAGKHDKQSLKRDAASVSTGLTFVYPYGASLNVQKPAVPIISSGYIAYPLNRPVGAVCESEGKGRLAVLGSLRMFDDEWIEKEENSILQDIIFKWLLASEDFKLDSIDADVPEVSDYTYIPDTEALASRVRSCLQESEEIPKDFMSLFDDSPFKFDTNLIPEVLKLYLELGVKHEPLALIPPQFETPLPPLLPAVFPPTLRELPPPALDLFDLDEHFASEQVRLAQLTNKCNDEDLEYYIRECGDIVGVSQKMAGGNSAKHILAYVLKQVSGWKKLNP
eukprot:TRINITY_DN467_c0_g1_i2.p1 TRINITY_DN467_c0_g1~~TRINITY_DN467_c0_g1_i2.p1  ORF type:complete len:432 (-),score=101.23 TRINITY_DN467_c0_g1_i2:139-1434(-)